MLEFFATAALGQRRQRFADTAVTQTDPSDTAANLLDPPSARRLITGGLTAPTGATAGRSSFLQDGYQYHCRQRPSIEQYRILLGHRASGIISGRPDPERRSP